MPQTEIEIKRTVTITRDEEATITVDVPQDVLDGDHEGFELTDWVEGQMKIRNSEVSVAVSGNWVQDIDDEDYEIHEAVVVSEG